MTMERETIKRYLIETLDFLKYKLENDKCTDEDMRSIYRCVTENVTDYTDTDSLCDFYHQSRTNVSSTLSRNLMPKPKRKVLYNFVSFLKIKPKSWSNK
jgi:hypothetical protein